jgi:hypothetical protein
VLHKFSCKLFNVLIVVAGHLRFSEAPFSTWSFMKLMFDIRNELTEAPWKLVGHETLMEEFNAADGAAQEILLLVSSVAKQFQDKPEEDRTLEAMLQAVESAELRRPELIRVAKQQVKAIWSKVKGDCMDMSKVVSTIGHR